MFRVRVLLGVACLFDNLASMAAGSACHFWREIARNTHSDLRFKASGVLTPFRDCGEV
jgi:hypothetical protein